MSTVYGNHIKQQTYGTDTVAVWQKDTDDSERSPCTAPCYTVTQSTVNVSRFPTWSRHNTTVYGLPTALLFLLGSIETFSLPHWWSNAFYSSFENKIIEWSWKSLQQANQSNSIVSLRLSSSNLQSSPSDKWISCTLESIKDDSFAERKVECDPIDKTPPISLLPCLVWEKYSNDTFKFIFVNR